MKVVVRVMPKEGVLDPQGKAIGRALASLGFSGVGEVRAGKVIELDLAETELVRARALAEEMARQLLANPVIERFEVALPEERSGSSLRAEGEAIQGSCNTESRIASSLRSSQ